jgi:type IV pilus assembly protein PilE
MLLNTRGYRDQRGFTLIELMIVLVIAGILFYVALPAYQNSIIKSNRSVGRGMIMDVASRQEQYFINNKAYTDDLTKLGYDADPFYINDQADRSATSGNQAIYKIDLNLLSTLAYSVTATPVPGSRQAKDNRCQAFTLSSAGAKTNSGPGAVSECW